MTDSLRAAAQAVVDEFITGNYELILARKINALRTALAEPQECEWRLIETYEHHACDTSCGIHHEFSGNPSDGGMKFCSNCGKKIRFVEGEL